MHRRRRWWRRQRSAIAETYPKSNPKSNATSNEKNANDTSDDRNQRGVPIAHCSPNILCLLYFVRVSLQRRGELRVRSGRASGEAVAHELHDQRRRRRAPPWQKQRTGYV